MGLAFTIIDLVVPVATIRMPRCVATLLQPGRDPIELTLCKQ